LIADQFFLFTALRAKGQGNFKIDSIACWLSDRVKIFSFLSIKFKHCLIKQIEVFKLVNRTIKGTFTR
jgi:hypothetical protein